MNIKQYIHILMILLSVASPSLFANAGTPVKLTQQFDMSKLSEQDKASMEFLEKNFPTVESQMEFLEAIMKEVEQLPKEQQEEFWNAVQAESERLEQVLVPVQEPEYKPEVITPKPTQAPAKPAPAKPITDTAKIDEILLTINTFINKLETILKKIQIIPDFDLKFSSWVKAGKISSIPTGIPFSEIKKQMQSLIGKLNELKAKDPITKDYKYLQGLLKNELLLNNIKQVTKTLSTHEPAIKPAEFGQAATLDPKTIEALQKISQSLGETFYRLGIPAGIEALFASYEGRSKELRESKEASIKSAQKAASHRVIPAKPIEAGAAPKGPQYKEPKYKERSFGGQKSTPSFYETPQTKPASEGKAESASTLSQGGSAGGAPAGGKPVMPSEPKKDLDETKKK